VVINFILAGRDTTAQLLSWACYMLIQHPEVGAVALGPVVE
jgi:fatty acid omega-hydroxylase